CVEYMNMKWERVARRRTASQFIYRIFVMVILAVTVMSSTEDIQCYLLINAHCGNWTNTTCIDSYLAVDPCASSPVVLLNVMQHFLLAYACYRMIVEFIYIVQLVSLKF